MKVQFTVSFEFENREELVRDIIEAITSMYDASELDSDYEDFDIPEDWKNPESWTDEAIIDFLNRGGGQFIEDTYGPELNELLNYDYYEHSVKLIE